MQSVNSFGFIAHADAFSIGTLILARLRRVTGRVIDVMYLVENKAYAQYIVDLSLVIQDSELNRQALRLKYLLDIESPNQAEETRESVEILDIEEDQSENISCATEEEIYQAQVSPHYIGALR